jgi:hypothetical protein
MHLSENHFDYPKLDLTTFVGVTESASEWFSYSYDAVGRLASSGVSGRPGSRLSPSTAFDSAGGRTGYVVTVLSPPRETNAYVAVNRPSASQKFLAYAAVS